MRKTTVIGILLLLPAAIVGGVSLLSCSRLECSTDTHEEGGKCVANLASTCGPGTYSSAGKCLPLVGSPCGANTSWDGDAGQCIGSGGGGGDGGTGAMHGARWTDIHLTKPESISPVGNSQLPGYFENGTIVILLRTEPLTPGSAVLLHGGEGVKTKDDPLTYTFQDGLVPTSVVASLEEPVTGSDSKQYTPFATAAEFGMNFRFIVSATNPQPPLYLYKASITGKLDADGNPVSTDPPRSGTIKGCFTPTTLEPGKAGATDIYIDVLQQTLKQLIDTNNGQLDGDCTGSGSYNGYLLEATWEASELTALETTTTDQDGGVTDAATTD
jgi:hypothetical protein